MAVVDRLGFNGTFTSIVATVSGTSDGHGIALTIPGDFGDAPASYGAAGHNNIGPTNPMMGNATYDTEASTPSGSSDDATGSDDETVTIPALTQGVTTTMAIPVLQATGK